MNRSIISIKNYIKDLTVIKTFSPTYFSKPIYVAQKDKIINKPIDIENVKVNQPRKWDFDMEGNPYYCDDKAR